MLDVVAARTAVVSLRIPRDLLDRVHDLAQAETRSVNGQLIQLVREALAARDAHTGR